MLLHRTFAHLATARPGESGHPDHLPLPQGRHRLDNPLHYSVWYLAESASGAVGETFGDLPHWRPAMLSVPAVPGSVRALGVYELPDSLPLLDLDDARNLADRALRPTQVVTRVRAVTQAWALRVFEERSVSGDRLWAGVRWWSYHRPTWPVYGIWGHTPVNVDVQELTMTHPAIKDAARHLSRRI